MIEKDRRRERKGGGRWSTETFGTDFYAPNQFYLHDICNRNHCGQCNADSRSTLKKNLFEVMGSASIAVGTVIGH